VLLHTPYTRDIPHNHTAVLIVLSRPPTFFTTVTLVALGTDAEIGGIDGFTTVGPRQVILQTLVTVKQTFTGTAGQSGSVTQAFGLDVIRTPRLQTRGAMIGIVGAGEATYVFVGLEAAQENELFFLGWTNPSCGIHKKELVVVERGSHAKFV